MPPCCSVPYCSNKTGGHKFPSNQFLLKQWLTAIRRESFRPSKHSRVCRQHFDIGDYESTKSYAEKRRHRLKKNAVPSKFHWNDSNLTDRTTIVCSNKKKKKIVIESSCTLKEENMSLKSEMDEENIPPDVAGGRHESQECRACLQIVEEDANMFGLFREWGFLLPGTGISVAEHLNTIANINITKSDCYSKMICFKCLVKLQEVLTFINMVQQTDEELRNRSIDNTNHEMWPKPILVNKNITSTNCFEIEIKQEVLTDDECNTYNETQNMENDNSEFKMDIKIEPEELQEDSGMRDEEMRMNNELNAVGMYKDHDENEPGRFYRNEVGKEENGEGNTLGEVSKTNELEIHIESKGEVKSGDEEGAVSNNLLMRTERVVDDKDTVSNGDSMSNRSDENSNDMHNNLRECDSPVVLDNIKQEKMSDDESDIVPDLPLDCMLCTKSFRSISGLKAHVIAQHSYGTVSRNNDIVDDTPPPKKYVCLACNRSFISHTDLIVHETCHGKQVCYACYAKFDTFDQLRRHRSKCKVPNATVAKLRTLEDAMRRSPDIPTNGSPDSRPSDHTESQARTDNSLMNYLNSQLEQDASKNSNLLEENSLLKETPYYLNKGNDMEVHLEIHSIDKPTDSIDSEMDDLSNSEKKYEYIISDMTEDNV